MEMWEEKGAHGLGPGKGQARQGRGSGEGGRVGPRAGGGQGNNGAFGDCAGSFPPNPQLIPVLLLYLKQLQAVLRLLLILKTANDGDATVSSSRDTFQ